MYKRQDIYIDESVLDYQKERYIKAIESFEELFGEKEVEIYSAPGDVYKRQTYVGQNRGAGKMDRVKQGVRCTQYMIWGWSVVNMIATVSCTHLLYDSKRDV